MNWNDLLDDFKKVSALAGIAIDDDVMAIECLSAPHTPPSRLPQGKMAVYIFAKGTDVLKVGKVGPKSQARYISQHYNPKSALSTLASSMLSDDSFVKQTSCNEANVGAWIKANLDRTNIILDQRLGIAVLTLLESYLQCRLKPKYEGFKQQQMF